MYMMQVCTKCNIEKDVTCFYKANNKRGTNASCKTCETLRGDKYRAKTNYDKLRYQQLKPKIRAKVRQRLYGLSEQAYNELLAKQDGLCAICSEPLDNQTSRTVVEHCHKSGKVRGLVHSNCNCIIGYANDDVTLLEKAINYLNRNKT